jgi:hypothetical protein
MSKPKPNPQPEREAPANPFVGFPPPKSGPFAPSSSPSHQPAKPAAAPKKPTRDEPPHRTGPDKAPTKGPNTQRPRKKQA